MNKLISSLPSLLDRLTYIRHRLRSRRGSSRARHNSCCFIIQPDSCRTSGDEIAEGVSLSFRKDLWISMQSQRRRHARIEHRPASGERWTGNRPHRPHCRRSYSFEASRRLRLSVYQAGGYDPFLFAHVPGQTRAEVSQRRKAVQSYFYDSRYVSLGIIPAVLIILNNFLGVSERPMPGWSVVNGFVTGQHGICRGLALDLKPIRSVKRLFKYHFIFYIPKTRS